MVKTIALKNIGGLLSLFSLALFYIIMKNASWALGFIDSNPTLSIAVFSALICVPLIAIYTNGKKLKEKNIKSIDNYCFTLFHNIFKSIVFICTHRRIVTIAINSICMALYFMFLMYANNNFYMTYFAMIPFLLYFFFFIFYVPRWNNEGYERMTSLQEVSAPAIVTFITFTNTMIVFAILTLEVNSNAQQQIDKISFGTKKSADYAYTLYKQEIVYNYEYLLLKLIDLKK